MASIDGPAILGSEAARCVYAEVLDLWDAGVDIAQVRAKTLHFLGSAQRYEAREYVLAALTKVFWEIGEDGRGARDQLEDLMNSGTSCRFWSAHADAGFAKRRQAALRRLLTLTRQPRKTPRQRRVCAKVARRLYSVGDCLILDDGETIHKGVVCKIQEQRGRCLYNVLVMEPTTSADVRDFQRRCYFGHILRHHSTNLVVEYAAPHVIQVEHRLLMRLGNPFKPIGRVNLDERRVRLGSYGVISSLTAIVEDFRRTPAAGWMRVMPLSALMAEGKARRRACFD